MFYLNTAHTTKLAVIISVTNEDSLGYYLASVGVTAGMGQDSAQCLKTNEVIHAFLQAMILYLKHANQIIR